MLCPVLEDRFEHQRMGSSERQRHSCALKIRSLYKFLLSFFWENSCPVGIVQAYCLYYVAPFALTSQDKNSLKERSCSRPRCREVKVLFCLMTCIEMVCRLKLVWGCLFLHLDKQKGSYHSRLPICCPPTEGKAKSCFSFKNVQV